MVLVLFLMAVPAARGQEILVDSLPIHLPSSLLSDTVALIDSARIKRPPDPKRAALLSLLLPGAGQVYNGKWWKTPFVYGALGGSVAYLQFNQSRYFRFKRALELELARKPHEFTGKINSTDALRNLRNRYDKNTQTSYVGVVIVYGIIAVEAFVDAHLQNFDISDDLSLRPLENGLGLVYSF